MNFFTFIWKYLVIGVKSFLKRDNLPVKAPVYTENLPPKEPNPPDAINTPDTLKLTPYKVIPSSPKYGDYPQTEKTKLELIVRRICSDSELKRDEANLICAVIDCESGFNPNCINASNKDGTADYGLVQANSYWYIGEGKPLVSEEEALTNVEKCIGIIVKRYKQGGLKDWICYRGGYYKSHLNKYV